MEKIEDLIKKRHIREAIQECSINNLGNLKKLLELIYNPTTKNIISDTVSTFILVRMECNWMDSKDLITLWSKMTPNNDGIWKNIKLIESSYEGDDCYTVIINSPRTPSFKFNPDKTILFRMEPNMHLDNKWGIWSIPSVKLLKIFAHETDFNNNEWHLSKTYTQLKTDPIVKSKCLSTVLSSKYFDYGHVKRVDFVKYIENDIDIDVYGSNEFRYKNYIKSLPNYEKDEAILPYKYTFNAENNEINNYYTEKIIDGILGECLTFYWGCPNLPIYVDNRAYVMLDLENFEMSKKLIEFAIKDNWYEKRLPYIKQAKQKILDELQFFPRLSNYLLFGLTYKV